MTNEEIKESILNKVKELNIKLIILQFVDILGTVKSVTIPVQHLNEALERGYPFDGSSVEGFECVTIPAYCRNDRATPQ